MKIAELEAGLRAMGYEWRRNDILAGRGKSVEGMNERWNPILQQVVAEMLKVDGAKTTEGTAVLFDFTSTEDNDPRRYRVRVHVDIEPLED